MNQAPLVDLTRLSTRNTIDVKNLLCMNGKDMCLSKDGIIPTHESEKSTEEKNKHHHQLMEDAMCNYRGHFDDFLSS